ncbi:MAG: C10 family peptidase [Treponema sp.]|nr:C10 family peptidase [Treponema sp.]
MKKLKKIVFALVAVVTMFGCKNNGEKINESVNFREITFEDSDSIQKEELLFYMTAENYKLSEEEVYSDLKSFLALKETGSEDDENFSRALDSVENQYEISKVKTFKKEFPAANIFARGIETFDEVNFSIYDISNPEEGTKGVAVTSDDERIGSLLCILDNIDCTDTEKDPVLEIFLANLDNYVEEVSNELESITEDDLELFKEKYNITDEEIAAAKLEYENSLDARKFWGYDSWSSWSPTDVNFNNLTAKTKWNQDGIYNDAIEIMEGGNYYTGCGATALAQLMAYHEYPAKYTRDDLDTLKEKWFLAANWDGTYEWKEMTAYPEAKDLNDKGKLCVAALMYDVSKSINSLYGPTQDRNGTASNMTDRIKYLRSIGYNCDNEANYSYSSIAVSLRKDSPVMIRGKKKNTTSGHAWIIDGSLELQRTRNYYVFWVPFKCTENQDYVHCNYGWSGYNDEGTDCSYKGIGYYKSGVFAVNGGEYGNLTIATNIYPKK